MIARRLVLSGLLCCVVLVSACGSAKYEWSEASTLNTVAAYQAFLSKYPSDPHAADAKIRIAQLQDEHAWSTAQATSTVEGYQQYLTAQPNGTHAQAAHDEIESRERTAAWQTAQTNETAQSLQEFLQKYPAGTEADRARAKLKVLLGYRAEFGTAHSQKAADRARDALAKRFSKDLQQIVVLEPDASNREYRITSAPMSESDANAACASVKPAGQSCKVVPTTG
jgi:outer membrane protein assembly factor BamD (BamD/ComL family)